jgi:hypothetical protein
MNPKWKIVIQKEPRARKVIQEVEESLLGLHVLEEELVTQ